MTSSAADRLGEAGNGADHLPYGSYSASDGARRLGVRLGHSVLDVATLLALPAAGPVSPAALRAVAAPSLDGLLRADRSVWDEVRAVLQRLVSAAELTEAVLAAAVSIDEVTMHLPFTVADYVDFYGNEHHATNVGRIFRPSQPALPPNWKHLPIGYHGRAGTVVASGTAFSRPKGLRPEPAGAPTFGPSRRLDIEVEMGFVLGAPVETGEIGLVEAAEHIFGLALVNDWSARDIQAYEYVPLGPNLGKSFCTSIATWVTPLAALDQARTSPPPRDTALSAYLDDSGCEPWGFDLDIEVLLNGEVVAVAPFAENYWTAAQMLAHMSVNGAGLRAGDLFASGTISGPRREQRGSFLEMSWDGGEPLVLADGTEFSFLRDGDEITLRCGAASPAGGRIALGQCSGTVLPAT